MNEIITHLVTPTPRISRVQIAVLVVSIIANIALGVFAISTPLTGAALKSDVAATSKCPQAEIDALTTENKQINDQMNSIKTDYQQTQASYQTAANNIQSSGDLSAADKQQQLTILKQSLNEEINRASDKVRPLTSRSQAIQQRLSACGVSTATTTGNTGILSGLTNTIGNAMGQTGITGGDNKLLDGATRVVGDAGVGTLAGMLVDKATGNKTGKGAMYGAAGMAGLSLVNQALSGGTGNSITGSALGAVGIGTGGGGLVDTLSNTFTGNKSASAATAEPPCVLDTKGQPLTIPASSWGDPAPTTATVAENLDCKSLVAAKEAPIEQLTNEFFSKNSTMEKSVYMSKLKEGADALGQLKNKCPDDVASAKQRQKDLLNRLNDASKLSEK